MAVNAVEKAGRDGGYSWICRPGLLILQAAGLIQHPLNLPARSRTKTPQNIVRTGCRTNSSCMINTPVLRLFVALP